MLKVLLSLWTFYRGHIWVTIDGTFANMVSRKGNADPAEVNDSPQVVTEKVWIFIVPSSCVTL